MILERAGDIAREHFHTVAIVSTVGESASPPDIALRRRRRRRKILVVENSRVH